MGNLWPVACNRNIVCRVLLNDRVEIQFLMGPEAAGDSGPRNTTSSRSCPARQRLVESRVVRCRGFAQWTVGTHIGPGTATRFQRRTSVFSYCYPQPLQVCYRRGSREFLSGFPLARRRAAAHLTRGLCGPRITTLKTGVFQSPFSACPAVYGKIRVIRSDTRGGRRAKFFHAEADLVLKKRSIGCAGAGRRPAHAACRPARRMAPKPLWLPGRAGAPALWISQFR